MRAVADRCDLAEGTAGDYMTSAPATVELDTPLAEVARTMLAYGIRHLPVVVAGEVIGMVSARDLLEGERHDSLTQAGRKQASAGGWQWYGRGTVASSATASKQRDCRYENPPPSPCSSLRDPPSPASASRPM